MTCGDVPPAKWEIPTLGSEIALTNISVITNTQISPADTRAGELAVQFTKCTLKTRHVIIMEMNEEIFTKIFGYFERFYFDKTPHKVGCSIYKLHAISALRCLAECFPTFCMLTDQAETL